MEQAQKVEEIFLGPLAVPEKFSVPEKQGVKDIRSQKSLRRTYLFTYLLTYLLRKNVTQCKLCTRNK